MKNRAPKITAILVAAAFVLSLAPLTELSAATAVGKITRMNGMVKIKRGGKTLNARVGARLMAGDIVETTASARVKMMMVDSTILNLGPKSKMRIRDYRRSSRPQRTSANYDLVYGKGRAKVPKRGRGGSRNVKFRTPTAVAGVRGTEFVIEYLPGEGRTKIITIEGEVGVMNPNVAGEEITLTPGMGTVVASREAPTSPFQVPVDEILALTSSMEVRAPSPRVAGKINLPGESGADINNAVGVPAPAPAVGGPGDLGDSGTVMTPEDLIDQEPPPYTPVILKLKLDTGA